MEPLWENVKKKAFEQIASKLIGYLWKIADVLVLLLLGFISNGEFSWKDLGLEFTWTELELCLSFLLLVFLVIHCIGGFISDGEFSLKDLGFEFTLKELCLSFLAFLVIHCTIGQIPEGRWKELRWEFTWTQLGLYLLFLLLVFLVIYCWRELSVPKETEVIKALRDGYEQVTNIRVMVVGPQGVGKTTLSKRLLGDAVNIGEEESTQGIDVHIHSCRVSHANGEWLKQDEGEEELNTLQRICKLIQGQGQGPDIGDEQLGKSKVMDQMETASDIENDNIQHEAGKKQNRVDSNASKPTGLYDEDKSNDANKVDLKAINKVKPGNKENSFRDISKKDNMQEMLEQIEANADKSDSEDIVKNMCQLIKRNADKLLRSRREYSPLSLWDFAGQYVYYTTHQTYLTQHAVYLLVLDLTKQLTDDANDDNFFDIEGKRSRQVHELVELWLNSIHSIAFLEQKCPPVILVGTHKDKIQQDIQKKQGKAILEEIRFKYLKGKPAIIHLCEEEFCIDNTNDDPELKALKKKIVELASHQPLRKQNVPGRWLLLEELLRNLRAKGRKVFQYDELKKRGQELDEKFKLEEELQSFLKFHHDLGNIIYFSTTKLSEYILLEPQWLIKVMKSLISDGTNFRKKHPEAEEQWCQFEEEGKLTQELLGIIWNKEEYPDLYAYKTFILNLMEKLNIIAKPNEDVDENKAEDFFLAPCMLRTSAPMEIISPKAKPECESSSVLCVVFRENFLPPPIFHRLLAVCIAKWKILKTRGIYQIFCGCGVFEINQLYRLTLYFKSYVIFARVTLAVTRNQTFDAKVCISVREFILNNLSTVCEDLNQYLKPELFIQCQCNKSVGDCLESMFLVEELQKNADLNLTCRYHDDCGVETKSLLKYWFQNEEQSSGTKYDSKNVNQQVGNAEQQVGDVEQQVAEAEQVGDAEHQVGDVEHQVGDAEHQVGDVEHQVGDVEHHVGDAELQVGDVELQVGDLEQQNQASAGPMPSQTTSDTDKFICIIYLLDHVGSRVLRQLLSHHTVTSTCTLDQYLAKHRNTINSLRRVFNQSQMDIMFPRNGDTNLDAYEITLLSTFLQNIVSTLSQQEKDMIKSLQEQRNKLFAPATSRQINSSDFQTYWNDIGSILTTLSQQCGDTVFEAEIFQEIQHAQISHILAGSCTNTLKKWLGMIETV